MSDLNFEDLKRRPLKICQLVPDNSTSNSALNVDPTRDISHYLPQDLPWTIETVFVSKATSYKQVRQTLKKKYDVYFNFCDGNIEEDRPGVDVTTALESFNVPFVGPDSKFFKLSKKGMKLIFNSANIPTPNYHFAYNEKDIEFALKKFNKFPLFVKHHDGYSSVGLTRKSRVNTPDELREQASFMIDEFGGALIEEFIEGEECTVFVMTNSENSDEPFVLDPIQYNFPEGDSFKHFDLKWVEYDRMTEQGVEDESLKRKLKEVTKKTFLCLSDEAFYARLDVRVNKEGEIFVLEVNAMPSVLEPPGEHGSSNLIIINDKNWDFDLVIYQMIKTALELHRRKQKPYTVAPRDIYGGAGLFATRDIKKGETILLEEEKAIRLVTKSYVDKNYKGIKKLWFDNYAYPVSDGMYALWDDNCEKWEPLNHSCDPNMWFSKDSLNCEAYRDIKLGEELTMDYCMFSTNPNLEFDCKCGAENCRGRVTSQDFVKPELINKFEGHFYPHLQGKIVNNKYHEDSL